MSYGLYLFNIPIFMWLDHQYTGLNPVPLTVLRFVVLGGLCEVR